MVHNGVLIIGGGAAGLAAALRLSGEGVPVGILEGRERLGGRMHTIHSDPKCLLVELGAEFIHGEQNTTWDYVKSAKLRTQKVPDRHWRFVKGELLKDRKLWDRISSVMSRINEAAPDQDFQSFVDHGWGIDPLARNLALEYAENFHAAPANRISVHALALAEEAAEKDEATSQFRIKAGYCGLVDWFTRQLAAREIPVYLNNTVKVIRWQRGRVDVITQAGMQEQHWQAERAVITLPLGVLQNQRGAGAVQFDPLLHTKQKAIEGLAMGSVFKMTLHFKSRFWKRNFGFIHVNNPWLPVWWSDSRGPLITAWAGGPRAEQLAREGPQAALAVAFRLLASLFKIAPQKLNDNLLGCYTHDWMQDPFACGAYSYTPVRMKDMPRRLAMPVAETLFFAGEATDSQGEQGTVHGALASGERAAEEVLHSIQCGQETIPVISSR
ncbi:MAG TPA: NAD(P)/FAD-dependent oxidoreductase [Candidatus Limnocylindrales bacterium]|nr:NAD(P)/FAD-dependent oxidoreductase [Candidatus Limnocylindrales bacterium]